MSVVSDALRAGSATLHEAMGRQGALPAAVKPVCEGFELAGPAFPVRSPVGDNLWLHRAVYAAQPGEVLVVAVPEQPEFGYWGEILSVAAAARDLAGLVITGGVRDVAALRDVAFPVFAGVVCIRGTIKDPAGRGALGEPVRIGDVVVRRGDFVLGDTDGVVVVPAADLHRTIEAAGERTAKENEVLARLRAGESTLDIYQLLKV
ncbi:RraA family protein [Pseudonocardia asaccharolytica]|uniref:Putative 4-hydroxy-4-methyl-2-oxoglutarate aldolase n=1 Tax=Pseudonocardia asaccharolytica DSM 44247 = NBRC 16224 TaxID=1123024 RepID=A0A511CXF6_9PSEU|nr:4-hydroxy-4-methyl-2-oxoglutarate aldolase [Pseudonocardia asaccharolytica]GEL17239.1 4-carboxy-4-hydroxy-2-oxoadipate aldolase [Pseudonocardia asaccharolytica DSM 44247 = NBRC 16224]